MRYKVRIEQEDVSVKLWTLTHLMTFLKGVIKQTWDTITISYANTNIIIERIK